MMRTICLIVITLLAATPTLAGTSIALRAEATVPGPQVTLGEIADIAADTDAAARLAVVVVAASPLPGKTHTVTRTQILAHLRRPGVAEAVVLTGAQSVAVTRSAIIVSGDDLAAAGRDALAALAPEEVTPEVVCSRRPADIEAPEGAVEVRAEVGPGTLGGTRTVTVAVLVDGKPYRTALVTYSVKLWAEVVVAKQFVPRHAGLDPAAFAVERRDIALIAGHPLRSLDELANLRATRAIPINAVVTEAQVEEPPVISRGDLVAVIVRSGAITVTTQAVALADARMGEAIRLRHPESKQEFEATAAGAKQAEIIFAPPASAAGAAADQEQPS
jgi:flagella basal body P-ring formation protein FlgA